MRQIQFQVKMGPYEFVIEKLRGQGRGCALGLPASENNCTIKPVNQKQELSMDFGRVGRSLLTKLLS